MNAVATAPAPDPTAAVVAPFALLRVAAVPYRSLLELVPPTVRRCVDRIVLARAAMASVRDALGLARHAAVPRAEDRALRAAVIELKRDVHNGRVRRIDPELLARVSALVGDDDRAKLAGWIDAAAGVATETTQLDHAFAVEIDAHTRTRLRALGDRPEISRPLVVSSRDLYRRLVAERTRLPRDPGSSKSERSLLGYVIRAAAKTSPFSTFMHVAAVRLDHGPALALDPSRRTARVQANRGAVNLLYRFGVAPARARAGAPLALDPSLRRSADGRVELVVREYVAVNRRPWRDDVAVRLTFHPRVADAVLALPPRFVWTELCAALTGAGLPATTVDGFATRLIGRGIVTVDPVSDGFDEDPARTLVEHATATPGVEVPVRVAAASVDRIRRELSELDAAGRLAACERLDTELAAALRSTGVAEPGFRNAVLEDGCFAEPAGRLPAPIDEIARDVAESMRPLIRLNGLYATLRDHFVELHGRGGRSAAVTEFLAVAHARLLGMSPHRPPQHRPPPPGVRAGLTVFCQVSRLEVADVRTQLAPVIINRAYAGIGWLSARRAMGQTPAHAALGTWIRDWLVEAAGDAEPVDLMLCGDCNDLQAHPRLTRRVLAWPTEPFRPNTDGVIPLDQIALRHDVTTDLIRFETTDGAVIAPFLLGNAMAMPGWGPKFVLVQLAQPFELQRPSIEPPADPGVEVEYRPPRVEGRVAHGRATWWMTASRMRARWFAHTGARRLVEVALDCAEQGVPTQFFVNAFLPPSPELRAVPEDALKPLWVDVRNPFCLDLLERITTFSTWMTIKEVFPDHSGMWAKVDGEAHASELALEIMV